MASRAAIHPQSFVTEHSVLVVDDEADIRESLAILLGARGYAVTTASNGQEALALIDRANPPQVMILDLIMPGMSGFELLKHLRKDPRDIYVIVVSATDRPPTLSADAFFQKPYSVAKLLAKVEQLCLAHDEMEKLRGF